MSGPGMLSVKLEAFEGPLDLLLHLIRKHEIDIFDIPIHFIAERFLEALDTMGRLDLDVGGEFLVMASALVEIKSRMLLPRPQDDAESDEEGADPRAELVRQLLEYQRYREMAAALEKRPLLDRDVFVRLPEDIVGPAPAQGPSDDALDLFELIDAFQRVARRVGLDSRFDVKVERRSVAAEMRRLVRRLCAGGPLQFADAILTAPDGEPDVVGIVGAFLAVLELVRLGLVRVRPSGDGAGPLMIEGAVDDLSSVLEQQ